MDLSKSGEGVAMRTRSLPGTSIDFSGSFPKGIFALMNGTDPKLNSKIIKKIRKTGKNDLPEKLINSL